MRYLTTLLLLALALPAQAQYWWNLPTSAVPGPKDTVFVVYQTKVCRTIFTPTTTLTQETQWASPVPSCGVESLEADFAWFGTVKAAVEWLNMSQPDKVVGVFRAEKLKLKSAPTLRRVPQPDKLEKKTLYSVEP